MKLYENTLFPHIKHVMQKFTKQLSKDDLKKFAKEVGKKLVASDFKNNRVEDPTKISEKQEKKVKKYVRDYFEKAVEKRRAIDKRKKEKEATKLANGSGSNGVSKPDAVEEEKLGEEEEADETMDLTPNSPVEMPGSVPATPSLSDLKRKREDLDPDTPTQSFNSESDSNKRLKEEEATPPPPPPPPPADSPIPIAEGDGMDLVKEETEEEKELRRQEEDLMRENEEAMKMDMDGSLKSQEEKASHNGLGVAANVNLIPSLPERINGNGNGNGMKMEDVEQHGQPKRLRR